LAISVWIQTSDTVPKSPFADITTDLLNPFRRSFRVDHREVIGSINTGAFTGTYPVKLPTTGESERFHLMYEYPTQSGAGFAEEQKGEEKEATSVR
jgi:hypothetical protein